MTDFNELQARPSAAAQRNPYDTALTVLWAIGLAGGIMLLLIGSLVGTSGYASHEASRNGLMQASGYFIATGIVFLAAHLASLAARWRGAAVAPTPDDSSY
jgi:hypothetical protein